MRLTSAHAVAIVALVLASGGSFAVARGVGPTQGPHAYQLADAGSRQFVAGRPGHQQLIDQLVVPDRGAYAVTAKLDVSIGLTSGFAGGTVACALDSVGTPDTSRRTLAPGDADEIYLTSVGAPARSRTGKQAIDLTCGSTRSAFVISAVRMTALTLGSFSGSLRP